MMETPASSAFPATVIVPLKDQRPGWLAHSLTSALEQTVAGEIIVVHATQTPASTREAMRAHDPEGSRLRLLPERRPGFAAALNTGIQAARAPRIGFLFSDDWLDRRTLEICLPLAADIVSTGQVIHFEADDGGEARPPVRQWVERRDYQDKPTLERRAGVLDHFLLLDRRAVIAAGGIDETVGATGPDDFDLIWTLLERGASVALVEEALYHYRDHGDPRLSTAGIATQEVALRRILAKHGVFGADAEESLRTHACWFGVRIADRLDAREGAKKDSSAPGEARRRGARRVAEGRTDEALECFRHAARGSVLAFRHVARLLSKGNDADRRAAGRTLARAVAMGNAWAARDLAFLIAAEEDTAGGAVWHAITAVLDDEEARILSRTALDALSPEVISGAARRLWPGDIEESGWASSEGAVDTGALLGLARRLLWRRDRAALQALSVPSLTITP
jgi:hypothetical protein